MECRSVAAALCVAKHTHMHVEARKVHSGCYRRFDPRGIGVKKVQYRVCVVTCQRT